MGTHRINYVQQPVSKVERNPPVTLPVMYKEERLALAIFDGFVYSYNLPGPVSELLDSGTFAQTLAFRDAAGRIGGTYTTGSSIAAIQLVFVDQGEE